MKKPPLSVITKDCFKDKVKFILSLNCAEVHRWTKVECKSHTAATEHVQQSGAQEGCGMEKQGLGDEWPKSLGGLRLGSNWIRCASWNVISGSTVKTGYGGRD